jgi:hypothetical protein
VPVLLVAGASAAIFVRCSPAMGLGPEEMEIEDGAKTAHTVMMLLKEENEKKKAAGEGSRAESHAGERQAR